MNAALLKAEIVIVILTNGAFNMTEKEHLVAVREIELREREAKVKSAKIEMDEGYKELLAKFERDYNKLKADYERELINLERDKQYLAYAKAELARNFEL